VLNLTNAPINIGRFYAMDTKMHTQILL